MKRMCRQAGKRCRARSKATRVSSYSMRRSATVPQLSYHGFQFIDGVRRTKFGVRTRRGDVSNEEAGEEGYRGRGKGIKTLESPGKSTYASRQLDVILGRILPVEALSGGLGTFDAHAPEAVPPMDCDNRWNSRASWWGGRCGLESRRPHGCLPRRRQEIRWMYLLYLC